MQRKSYHARSAHLTLDIADQLCYSFFKMKRPSIDEKRRKKYLALFVVLILFISVLAVFGDKGFIDVYRLNKEKQRMISVSRPIAVENKRLSEEIRLLETDDRYIGSIARKELGMIGPGEMLYITTDAEPPEVASK